MQKRIPLLFAVFCVATAAQTALAGDFPEGATTPSAAELQQRLSDKNFSTRYASGVSARLQFKSDGYFFFDASNNARATGTWKAEDGMLCTNMQTTSENCLPARISEDRVHLQRANGEIIRYEPR